jgi:hypothetical protein
MNQVFKTVNFFFILFAIIITSLTISRHTGNIYYYILFSVITNALLIYTLNSRSLFFEIYLSSFIWLGFWFKYSLSLVFLNGIIYDSGPLENMINIDKAILVSIVAISSVFLSFILRKKIYRENIYQIKKISFFEKSYLKFRKESIFLFIILFCFVAFLNLHLNIYQKGFIYQHEISFLIVNFIKWMLIFGMTTLSCFFIYTEILRLQKVSPLLITVAFFEICLSYSSMLSRAVIMNLSAITFSLSKYLDLIKNKKFLFMLISSLLISMILFNNYFSNHIRINFAQEVGNDVKNKQISDKEKIKNKNTDVVIKQFKVSNDPKVKLNPINMSSFIIINRWSGIDSMIAIVSSKKLSFELFFQSLKEKKIINNKTFYETTFKVDWDGGKEVMTGEKRVLKGNTLPGLFSYLFYSGNYYFLFTSIFVLTFIFSVFEIFCKRITNNNMIFASFISFMICFRMFNFGYAPRDTYLFVISVLLSVLMIFFLSRFNFFSLHKKNNN